VSEGSKKIWVKSKSKIKVKEQHQGFQGQIMLNFAEQTGSGAVMIV